MYARVLIGCVNYTMDARTTVRNYAVNPLLYDPFYDSSLSLSLSFFFALISFLRYTWMFLLFIMFHPCVHFSFSLFILFPFVLFFFLSLIFSKRFHFIHAFYNILSTALYLFLYSRGS